MPETPAGAIDVPEIVSDLKRSGRIFEANHVVATFVCTRETRGGREQRVRVEIMDAGDSVDPAPRYYVRAVAPDGQVAVGNGADTISEALAIVHWDKLDAAEGSE